ncbi:hypothetical protein ACFHW2_22050 [Actinomadura sp. LOL_016]|uniref:hypothetical protein n=1 Tax=unclassified Actinomadura TaxID=2626254 RepID=UPI003A803271
MRGLTGRAASRLPAWRGRSRTTRHLDDLAVVLRRMGYHCIVRRRPPLLWVVAFGQRDHVRVAVGVHAVPGGAWAYHEAGGRRLCPCDGTEGAAELVDRLLKHRMFPATW